MQLKPITAIVVLSLVVASLLVSGCVQKEISLAPANKSAYPTSGRSLLVEAITKYDRDQRWFDTYNVKWINNTTAQATGKENIGDNIMTSTTTYTHFPTVEAASAYFDLLRSQYPEKREGISFSDVASYYDVTGKFPTVTKQLHNDHYVNDDYSRTLTQQDALITQRAVTFYYPNVPTNQA
jgi:hypothetical protein